jgi:hypothetical protein
MSAIIIRPMVNTLHCFGSLLRCCCTTDPPGSARAPAARPRTAASTPAPAPAGLCDPAWLFSCAAAPRIHTCVAPWDNAGVRAYLNGLVGQFPAYRLARTRWSSHVPLLPCCRLRAFCVDSRCATAA